MRGKLSMALLGALALLLVIAGCETDPAPEPPPPTDNNPAREEQDTEDRKAVVYQMMTRLFANTEDTNRPWGTIEENGVSTFNDITDTALEELADLGVTHVYYTGVIDHHTMVDFTDYGFPLDDADIIKGRAGSPFAIRDYFDVTPLLAEDIDHRMQEFEALIDRTHDAGMEVIIDLVPNHVGRGYESRQRPEGIPELGEGDDETVEFDPDNNFYYLPDTEFQVPEEHRLPDHEVPETADGHFEEVPAKVTGNDVFSPSPSHHDWFETVKLNYGVDVGGDGSEHFDPIPDTWHRMLEIMQFWAERGVDGFRVDMVQMVPVEFFEWAVPQVREINPNFRLIAEIYAPGEYRDYVERGGFDVLYDKVGVYDTVRAMTRGRSDGRALSRDWRTLSDIQSHMIRFMENHDEQRLASPQFAGSPDFGIPGMMVTSTMHTGPIMLYFGQEVGEPGEGDMGFSTNDGRTSIFDFWGVPEHQKWVNDGAFDGGQLSEEQQELRSYYQSLFAFIQEEEVVRTGYTYDLDWANERNAQGYDDATFAYIRHTEDDAYLFVANFDDADGREMRLTIPEEAWAHMDRQMDADYEIEEIFWGRDDSYAFNGADVADPEDPQSGVRVTVGPVDTAVYRLSAAD